MTTVYRVGISAGAGNVDGWALDLPGCRYAGVDAEEVRRLMPVVIAEHLAWLRGHGEDVDPDASFAIDVVEVAPPIGDSYFQGDQEPLSAEDLALIVARVGYAQRDLMALAGLPDQILDWKPPASAVKIGGYPDVRSPREMVAHVAEFLTIHLRGLSDLTDRVPGPAVEGIEAAFGLAVARLRALNADELAGTVYRRPGQPEGTGWTARKSIRRLIGHVRFHAREIEQRLCWLALGVPEVLPVPRE
jgi:hypothetical protein